MGRRELGRDVQRWVVLLTGTGTRSPPTLFPNKSGRDVVVALKHVGTNVSGLNMPPVSLRAFPGYISSKPQYPLPQPLL